MRKNQLSDIWKFVAKAGAMDCWPYSGGTFSGRYGRFSCSGSALLAHRVVYELVNGQIADGLFVMHKCNNKLCCNPTHLTVGTNSENQRHASASGAWPLGASGLRGISFDKVRGYWRAQGYLNGKLKNLYTGPHKEKALTARDKWELANNVSFNLTQKGLNHAKV